MNQFLIFFFVVGILVSGRTFAGGMTSSGGEFVTTERNPWFVGEEPVKFCISVGNGFSASLPKARKAISAAFDDWLETLRRLKPEPTPFVLPNGLKVNLALDFKEVNCSESPNLRFELGTLTDEIREVLSHSARYTAAFAGHDGIDDISGRVNKGVIWLVPDNGPDRYLGPTTQNNFWSNDSVLFNVLVHELGHVFGFEHQDDGVMNEGFPAAVIFEPLPRTTSRRYIFNKWAKFGDEICGKKLELPREFTRDVLGTSYIILWDVCIKPKFDDLDHIFHSLHIAFTSEEGIVAREYNIDTMHDTSLSKPSTQIKGQYFSATVGGPLDYKHHSFISLESQNRYSGYIEENSNKMPVIISRDGTEVNVAFIQDHTLYEFSFYIENMRPNLGDGK
jgi:hypothetical protein